MSDSASVVVRLGERKGKGNGRGGRGAGGGGAGGGDRAPDDWRQRLVRSREGDCKSTPHNLMLILENDEELSGLFALDEFANQVTITRNPPWRGGKAGEWLETGATQLAAWLGQPETYMMNVKSSMVMEAVEATANINRHHPVREYLEGLEWDGVERIPSLFPTYFGTADNPYTRGVGLIFMISAVARILQPGCKVDTMLVLEGRQGAGKTRVTQMLFGGDRWYMDAQRSPTEKDFYQDLQGKWGVEIGELVSFTKSEANKVKQTLSATADTYRPSYGRYSRTFPRQNVFIGTTNEDQPLRDATGARRFLPVRVGTVNVEELRTWRDQLWAEAVVRYRRGESWWELPEGAAEEQEDRYQADAWEEPVARWLEGGPKDHYAWRINCAKSDDPMKRGEVLECSTTDLLSFALRVDVGRQDRQMQMRVAAIMTRFGWPKHRVSVGNQRVYLYYRPYDDEPTGAPPCPA